MTQYSDLIPNYNRKPKFTALINALTAAYTQLQNAAVQIPTLYDINNAQGTQLDVVGQWIGLPRTLFVSSNEWFSYDIIDQGWNIALWYRFSDNTTQKIQLPDFIYRILLKTKIQLNQWQGDFQTFKNILNTYFDGQNVSFTITQPASMTVKVTIQGFFLKVLYNILKSNILPFQPAGVNVIFNSVYYDGEET